MIKRLWQWFKNFWQRLFGRKQAVPLQKTEDKVKPPKLSDAEYERFFMQLLDGVRDESWRRERVGGFLAGNNIAESDLVGWLRGFGERLLAGDAENRELAERMIRLGEVGCGELSLVTGEIGKELLGGGGEEKVNHEVEEKNISEVDKLFAMLGKNDNSTQQHSPNLGFASDKQQVFLNQLDITNILLDRGIELFEARDYEGSIASYDKVIEIKPYYYDAWYIRGLALFYLGRLEEAIASHDKAIEIKPDYYQAWYSRGIALGTLGKFEQAIESFNKAIEFKPDFHQAWYNRGVVLVNLGRLEQAIASYDKAIEIKPDDHSAWYNRGIALSNLGRLEKAIASYDKVIEIKPDDYSAWNNRGNALGNSGRLEQAIASYDKAVEIKPDYHQAWLNRGVACGKSISFNPHSALQLSQRGFY